MHYLKLQGAMKQVRFEPCFGKFLATASGNRINLFDVVTGCHQFSLKVMCSFPLDPSV